jgi:GAF domain-containing protein
MAYSALLRKIKNEIADLRRENDDLKDENSRLWNVINTLNDLESNLEGFSSSEDIRNLIMEILSIALEAVGSENGSILLLDEESEELVFVAVIGERQTELIDFRIPANSGVAGWVNNHRKPALVPNVRSDDRWISAVDQSIGFHTQSLMAVPLILEDRVLGVMEVVNSLTEEHFTETDLTLLQLVARLASFVFGYTEETLNKKDNPFSIDSLN